MISHNANDDLGFHRFTKREMEVIQATADGSVTNADVAETLKISEDTVRRHWENMRNRHRVASKAGVVALAFQNGWVK